MKAIIAAFLFITVLNGYSFEKSKYDSLYNRLNISVGKEKVDLYNDLGDLIRSISTDSSLYYFQLALPLAKEIDYKEGLALSYQNIGINHFYTAEYDNAIENFLKSSIVWEQIGDSIELVKSWGNIGILFKRKKEYGKALEYQSKVYKYFERLGDDTLIARSSINMGELYRIQEDFEIALQYYWTAVELKKKIGDKEGLAIALNNIGVTYSDKGMYDQAEKYLEESLAIELQINDKLSLSNVYMNLCDAYEHMGKYEQSIRFGKLAIRYATELNLKEDLMDSYLHLSQAYEMSGQLDSALLMFRNFNMIKDSILNESVNNKMAEFEIKYETAKKDKEITILGKDKELQKIIIYSSIFVLLVVFLFLVIINNKLKITRKQKKIIEEQSSEIQQSINYAKRIQNAVLPEMSIKAVLPKSFLIYKPKDVVSGDFYWYEKVDNKVLVSVADCTGHGVPGGFMSMLGTVFLNEIFNSKHIYQPSKILDTLNHLMDISLKSEHGDMIRDGMDISFGVLNTDDLSFEWSGANNPLYIVRGKKLIDYKPNKQPIGFSESRSPFESHKIQLQKEDEVYLFSDGFSDQFGGGNDKKIGSRKFKEILINNSFESIETKKDFLVNFFDDWKGSEEQTDDVCIIGFKI